MIFIAEKEDFGKRTDNFMAQRSEMSRSAVQKLIKEGAVSVNGKICTDKSFALKEGDSVCFELPEPEALEIKAENIPLDVVYEDDSLLVVNKSKGMVVHPAVGNPGGTLVNALLYHCGDSLSGINGVIRPGIVHRIDKNTSGLLVVAKNDRAHIGLAAQIAEHSVLRSYHAVCIGRMREQTGRIEGAIGRHPLDRKKMAILKEGGRYAATKWKVLEELQGFTYINCVLETGRTHQIRVHMSSIGHPLLCDDVYGPCNTKFEKQNMKELCGQCLHAKTLGFIHPESGKEMYFESPLPEYFENTLTKLRNISK